MPQSFGVPKAAYTMVEDSFSEIVGAIHLHTSFSDGGVAFPELISAAREVGLDYIVVTDHMSLGGRHAGWEGVHGRLCVLVGYEHNDTSNRNHYLVLGPDSVAPSELSPQQYVDYVRNRRGVGFIAHPMEQRNYFSSLPAYPWTAWEVGGFDGIEIWNQMSDWVENLKCRRSAFRIFFPRRFMSDVSPALMRKWDDLNRRRYVAAIGGVDAHTRSFNLGLIRFTVFPIKVELKGIRTHLYLEKALPLDSWKTSRHLLLEALRRGRGFVANYRRGDARGTRIVLRCNDGRVIPPGAPEASLSPPACIEVHLPEKGEIVLMRNGKRMVARTGTETRFDVHTEGVYRVEVRKKSHTWIYCNPFVLGSYPLE